MNGGTHFFQLLLALTKKEIKARYKHAVLGFLWIFINPLIQMFVMGFVFSLVFEFKVDNYYLFLFTGLLPWNFFSLSVKKATPRIVWDRNLIKKSSFPRSVIPLSIVLSHFFHFLISWGIYAVFLILTQGFSFFTPLFVLTQLIAIILLLVFICGISLITSCLNVFYRDINFFIQALTLIWFYATPVIYPLKAIPEKYLNLFYLNPLSGIFSFLQKSFTGNNFPFLIFLAQIIFIFFILGLGIIIFKSKEKYFDDWL